MSKGEANITRLGEYVRARRHAQGLSLQEAERRSGVDLSYWSRLELGEIKSPNVKHLANIARAIDVAFEDLFALAGYYVPQELPSLTPYLRARYDLDPADIAAVEAAFDRVRRDPNADRRAA